MFVFLLFSNLLWDNVDDGDAVLCGRDLYTNSAHIDIFAIVRPAIVTILQETVDYFLDKTVDQVRVWGESWRKMTNVWVGVVYVCLCGTCVRVCMSIEYAWVPIKSFCVLMYVCVSMV